MNSEPPSSIIRNIGTQTALELDDPDAQVGMPLERAVQDQVGARERGRGPEEHRVERRHERVVGSVYQHVVERPALVGDVEHRAHAVLDERAPDRVVVGMRQRAAVDERGRNHRELHAVALQARELGEQPLLVAQRDVRDGMHLAPAVGDDRARTNGSTRSCSR